MNRIKFAHIAPAMHILHAAAHSDVHMALAHLCKPGSDYVNNFVTVSNEGGYIYMDNSQYELGYAMKIDDVIAAAQLIGAKCVILPDGELTYLDHVKSLGFEVMYIPSARDLLSDFREAIFNPNIDRIGLSYSKTSEYLSRGRHSSTSRFDFLGMVGDVLPNKKIHMLGMVTAGEIALMKPYQNNIFSWDTSIAVWGGLTHVRLEDMRHKNTIPVDFESSLHWNSIVDSNIEYINKLLLL